MQFSDKLVTGRLVQRYKRFLADVELGDGTVVTAHCANPGAMTGLNMPGLDVWLSPNRSPTAKLDWRWELVRVDGHLIGVNTARPNAIVEEAIADDRIAELVGYADMRREVRYGENSRIDILLEDAQRPACYVEVKNVHLRRPEGAYPQAAEFPDSVTKRGAKHLVEMSNMVAIGARAVMVYLVQRGDCDHFRIAADIDPAYASGLARAREAGVEAICCVCRIETDGIEVNGALPIVLDETL
jgi:sugar fermentation stimulation protein A